jgi:hypothetical protein
MPTPIRLVTKVRTGWWHVWRLPDGSLRQTECSQAEYRRMAAEPQFLPAPPDPAWRHDRSFEGPVLSSGLQHFEHGDLFEDEFDYLIGVERIPGRVDYHSVPRASVKRHAITGAVTIDDRPSFIVVDNLMEKR